MVEIVIKQQFMRLKIFFKLKNPTTMPGLEKNQNILLEIFNFVITSISILFISTG